MTSEAKKKARNKYNAKRQRLYLDFYPTETELWEHINKQENKQGYIKDLIRKDISPTPFIWHTNTHRKENDKCISSTASNCTSLKSL